MLRCPSESPKCYRNTECSIGDLLKTDEAQRHRHFQQAVQKDFSVPKEWIFMFIFVLYRRESIFGSLFNHVISQ